MLANRVVPYQRQQQSKLQKEAVSLPPEASRAGERRPRRSCSKTAVSERSRQTMWQASSLGERRGTAGGQLSNRKKGDIFCQEARAFCLSEDEA